MRSSNEEKRKLNPKSSREPSLFLRIFPHALFVFSGLLVCGVTFFSLSFVSDQQEFVLDEPTMRSYFSPFSFSYVDAKKTEALRLDAVKNIPPVYRVDGNINKQVLDRVNLFFQTIADSRQDKLQDGGMRWKKLPFQIPTNSLTSLLDADFGAKIRAQVLDLLSFYLARGVISFQERSRLAQAGEQSILVAVEGTSQEELQKLDVLLTKSNVLEEAPSRLTAEIARNKAMRTVVFQILETVLTENLLQDNDRLQGLRKKAAASVKPVEIKIRKNELIVQRGMLVTQEIKDRLDQIHQRTTTRKQQTRVFAGVFLILLCYALSYFYFKLFEPKIFQAPSKLLLCHTVVFLNVVICKGVALWPDASIYLMPTALSALLLTLLLHNRAGIWGGAMMTVFAGFLSGFRADVMLGTLFVTSAVIFLSYRVRKRVHFFRIGLGMGAAYFCTLGAFQLAQNAALADAFHVAVTGFLGAVFSSVLSFLLVPALEVFFDVITDLTLLELSDLNHPLIRKMMVQAPGTYHHSLVVSSLAEHACEMIGANALLAKVGCYFHDIGKIRRPEYFSENQGYLYPNLHDRLPPRLSYAIIVSHVRQGIRLARQHKLKKAIIDFIAEHQGTGVIYYFYKRAMDQAQPVEHVRANDYRYPGPKPQSRETAVVLLADSVEAASRSLKDPSHEAIQQLVRKIINDKFIDGQLDECELTLRDLHKIQDSFLRNLSAIFHTRMKYPVIEKYPGAPDLFQENQFSKFRVSDEP